MILGHEVAGVVEAVGAEATRVKLGDRVAVNPSVPCNRCRYCLEGLQNQCLDMRFYGSAMRFPHVQGAFREVLVCRRKPGAPYRRRNVAAGGRDGRAARRRPARREARRFADGEARAGQRLRTDRDARPPWPRGARVRPRSSSPTSRTACSHSPSASAPTGRSTSPRDPDALKSYAADKGYFDALFEASGAEAALRAGIDVVRPRGVIVQLGLGGDMTIPINLSPRRRSRCAEPSASTRSSRSPSNR